MLSFSKDLKITRVLNGVVAGTSAQPTTVVDMAGWSGVVFIAAVGALTATQVTSLKAQWCVDAAGTTPTDLTGAATAAMADGDGNKLLVVDIYKPTQRFIRANVLRATANAVIDGVIAIQYRGSVSPVTQPTSVKEAVWILSPASA